MEMTISIAGFEYLKWSMKVGVIVRRSQRSVALHVVSLSDDGS